MKHQPHQNPDTHNVAGRSHHKTTSSGEQMNANRRHIAPSIPYRRYPSLSDDGQPWFPRAPWSRQLKSETSTNSSLEENRSQFSHIRLIALLGILAFIALLVANA
jgi:hypothetical protein